MPKRRQHLYKILVKFPSPRSSQLQIWKKWNTSDLLKFVDFLDARHSNWLFFNVISKRTNKRVASFTKYNRPTVKRV